MTNPRVIQQTPEYNIIEADFKGTVQTFRQWLNGFVEIKFNHDFALANGFKGIADMLRNEPNIRYQINMYCGGIVPEWIVIIDGEFMIKTNIQSN